jgi:DNA-binding transcriptional LysR family regulator
LVELEILEALDGLQWLRSGEEVAKRFGFSQPTVSRSCRKALAAFHLEMERRDGEWELVGDPCFLRLEREVHQMARWLQHRPLRLEATYWSAPTLCRDLPGSYMLGLSNIVGVKRNFQLLSERIVDFWIAGLPDLPTAHEPDLTAVVLSRMPVFFTCAPDHPLVGQDAISYDDIAAYPTLALRQGDYPAVEQALKAVNLWSDGTRMTRYRRDRWEGRSESDLVIGYGTPLSMHVAGGNLVRLPLQLPFDSGDALVFRKEYALHPRVNELIDHLVAQLKQLAQVIPEIEITSPRQQPHTYAINE